MLYIGHFDFLKESDDGDIRHGYFTCVAEADGIDSVLEKFRVLIGSLKEKGELFNDVHEIYLDSCVEVTKMPEPGFLAHYVTYHVKDYYSSISTSVCGTDTEQCRVYGYGEPEEDGEECEREPFLVFD